MLLGNANSHNLQQNAMELVDVFRFYSIANKSQKLGSLVRFFGEIKILFSFLFAQKRTSFYIPLLVVD